LLLFNHFVANAGGERPLADVDLVVDKERMGLGGAPGVAVIAAIGGRQLVGCNGRAVAQFMAGFVDIAIARAHFVAGVAQIKALGYACFDPPNPVFPW